MSRFNYIRYDGVAQEKQSFVMEVCKNLESEINSLTEGRAKSLAMTKLEECYMWIGKAIRDEQILRNSQSDNINVPERG